MTRSQNEPFLLKTKFFLRKNSVTRSQNKQFLLKTQVFLRKKLNELGQTEKFLPKTGFYHSQNTEFWEKLHCFVEKLSSLPKKTQFIPLKNSVFHQKTKCTGVLEHLRTPKMW